jgi:protocatechuate 3,4-dioxygenase beta subunit
MKAKAVALAVAFVAAVSFVLFAQAAPRAPQAPPRDTRAVGAAGSAVIRGRVVAADSNRPVSLATISASAPQLRESRSISTNSEGRYEIRNLPAGRYTLTVSRSGYLTLQYGQRRVLELGTPLDIANGQVIDDIDFILPRMSVITGRLTDEEGEPVAGARVFAAEAVTVQGSIRLSTFDGNAATDDSGAYRITGLSPGRYAVLADTMGASWTSRDGGVTRTQGYAATYFPGVTNPGAARVVAVGLGEEAGNIDFSVAPARLATISGTLVDSSGRPITNAAVAVVRTAGAAIGGFSGARMAGPTREDGAFTLANLPPGEITLVGGSRGVAGPGAPEAAI